MRITYLPVLLLLFALAGCATLPEGSPRNGAATPGKPERPAEKATSIQKRIVDAAMSFVGQNPDKLYVGDREFLCDCTGVVLASYYKAGIDLTPAFAREQGNGVARLHGVAERYDLSFGGRIPQAGDIIFWDNTYDRDGDGAWGDPLTHAGIVVHVHPDGQIEYVHHNYRQGVVVAYMNLNDPETYQVQKGDEILTVNSAMRMKSHRYIKPEEWLSSHLFRSFGRLSELPASAR